MKKFVIISLMVGTAFVYIPTFEAAAGSVTAAEQRAEYPPQRDQRWQRRGGRDRRDRRVYRGNRGRAYSYITTRYVQRWFRTYRETIRVTHLPNGRTRTQVLYRVRVR